MFQIIKISSFFLLMLAFFAGCSNSTDPENDNFSMSFKSESAPQKINADSLIIDTVKVLIRDVKVKPADKDSVDIKVGPFVLYFTPNSAIQTITINRVPSGTYHGAAFSIHKLENSVTPPDPEFWDSPDNRYSVIVKGTFNGTPFIYKSEKSAKQKINFETPVNVDEDLVNITLVAAPYTWFMKNGAYLDPLNADNVSDIDNLIKDAFKRGFVDNNKDGIPD